MAQETKGKGAAKAEQQPIDDDGRAFAAIAYILGLVIAALIYLLKKESRHIRFHAMQAVLLDIALIIFNLALFLILIAIAFLLGLASGGIGFFGGFILIYVLFFAWSLAIFIAKLFFAWKAYHGESFALPIIGAQADKMSAPSA